MSQQNIKVSQKGKDPMTITYDVPDTLDEFIQRFGADVSYGFAKGAFVIALQAIARRNFDDGQTAVQNAVNAWVPGTRVAGVKRTPLERATAALSGMSAQDLTDLLAKVKAAQKG